MRGNPHRNSCASRRKRANLKLKGSVDLEYATAYILLAAVFGLFMAWGIGANDVANAMGTSVGAGALTLKQAVMIAAVFEFLGAFLAGGEVTSTIRSGIIRRNRSPPNQIR